MIRLFSACALLCAFFNSPAFAQNFLEGVVSIGVKLTKEETRIASQYGVGDGYHGRRTASGERFNTYALMAPHKSRRFGRHVTVTNKNNGRSVRVRITDRGPFIKGPHRPVSSSSQRNRHGRDRARNRSVAHEAREGDPDDPVLFTERFSAGEKLSDLRQKSGYH